MNAIKEYNELIIKINKAERFIIEHDKDDKILDYLAKFMKAMDRANELIIQIEAELGRKMTSREILEGIGE